MKHVNKCILRFPVFGISDLLNSPIVDDVDLFASPSPGPSPRRALSHYDTHKQKDAAYAPRTEDTHQKKECFNDSKDQSTLPAPIIGFQVS